MRSYLKALLHGREAVPPVESPPLAPAPHARTRENTTAPEPHAATLGRDLRARLFNAAEASREGRVVDAADHYAEARRLCQRETLPHEEAMVLLALGGAALSAGQPALAAQSFEAAATLAAQASAWELASQAWLGLGSAHLTHKDDALAAIAYRAAATAARSGAIPPLAIEALRMAGTCLSRLGRNEEALGAWHEAVEIGAAGGAIART